MIPSGIEVSVLLEVRVFEYQKSEGVGSDQLWRDQSSANGYLLKYPMDAQNHLAQSVSDGDRERMAGDSETAGG